MSRLFDKLYVRRYFITIFCLITYLFISFIYAGVHYFCDISDILGFSYAILAAISYSLLLLDKKIKLRNLISISLILLCLSSAMQILSLVSDSLRMSNSVLIIEIISLPFLAISLLLFLTKRYSFSFKFLIIHLFIKIAEFIAVAFQLVSSVSSFTEFLVLFIMTLILVIIALLFELPFILNIQFLNYDE